MVVVVVVLTIDVNRFVSTSQPLQHDFPPIFYHTLKSKKIAWKFCPVGTAVTNLLLRWWRWWWWWFETIVMMTHVRRRNWWHENFQRRIFKLTRGGIKSIKDKSKEISLYDRPVVETTRENGWRKFLHEINSCRVVHVNMRKRRECTTVGQKYVLFLILFLGLVETLIGGFHRGIGSYAYRRLFSFAVIIIIVSIIWSYDWEGYGTMMLISYEYKKLCGCSCGVAMPTYNSGMSSWWAISKYRKSSFFKTLSLWALPSSTSSNYIERAYIACICVYSNCRTHSCLKNVPQHCPFRWECALARPVFTTFYDMSQDWRKKLSCPRTWKKRKLIET